LENIDFVHKERKMEKIKVWKEKLDYRHVIGVAVILIGIMVLGGSYFYNQNKQYVQASQNNYNMAFYELVDYVQNVEVYLAKSLISNTPEHGAETLTHVWREANLAHSYLSMLPIGSNELSNTEKFLNQVSDYSFTLSRKNINHEPLTQEELDNLKELHAYSVELENTLNQLAVDMSDGRIAWEELTKQQTGIFAKEVSNLSLDSFSSLEENFHEYAGLIYDGAFSEHLTSVEKKGLTGEDIAEEQAKQKAIEFIGEDKIEEIHSNGLSENATIPAYDFYITARDNRENTSIVISVSKKGGHIVFMNYNRNVEAQVLSFEQAGEIGRNFLESKGFPNMRETYYSKQEGIITVNYAYTQEVNGKTVTMYPDLVKVKVALDNGEILGMETTGYLNSHAERTLPSPAISMEKAKESVNKNLELTAEGLAVIPTQWQTEIFCYEFKGKVEDREFLVYINAETGKEEDVLIILNTENGILTQ